MKSIVNFNLGSLRIQISAPSYEAAVEYARFGLPFGREERRRACDLLLGDEKRSDPAALRISEKRSGGPDPETGFTTRQGCQRGVWALKNRMFEELLESVREGGAILRGDQRPARRTVIQSSGVRVIRERTRLSQSEFAQLIGVSVKTLQNWEQDRRRPTGPAAALLSIIDHNPALAVKAIHRV
jgi:putative transcriptional regulator